MHDELYMCHKWLEPVEIRLETPKILSSDFALVPPNVEGMVKSNITTVKFSEFHPQGMLVGYLEAIYAYSLRVPKKLIF